MRSSSFIFATTTLLLLAAACGDDTSTSGSGGGDATTGTSSDASSSATTSSSGGEGGDTGAGGEGGTTPTTTSTGVGGDGGGTGGEGTGGAGGEGTGGAGGEGGEGGEDAQRFFGRVLFSNGYYGTDDVFRDGGVSATFSEITPGDPSGCAQTVEGDCTLILCPPFEGDPPVASPRLAGDLTVDGTLVDATVTYDDEFDYYGFYVGGEPIYASGDELGVAATGDDVPAFTGSVVAPAHATLTSPTDADLTFSLDDGLDFTWDVEGAGGRLLASLDVYDEDGSYAILYCDWPMDDGAATMPASLMAEMPPTDSALLSLYDFAVTSLEVGEWVVEVAAQGTTQGASESGTASFEGVVLE